MSGGSSTSRVRWRHTNEKGGKNGGVVLLRKKKIADQSSIVSFVCLSESHKHGDRKVTETSVTEFCY